MDIPIKLVANGAIQTDQKSFYIMEARLWKPYNNKRDVGNEFDGGFYRDCVLQKEVTESESRGDDNETLNGLISDLKVRFRKQ